MHLHVSPQLPFIDQTVRLNCWVELEFTTSRDTNFSPWLYFVDFYWHLKDSSLDCEGKYMAGLGILHNTPVSLTGSLNWFVGVVLPGDLRNFNGRVVTGNEHALTNQKTP